MLPRRTPIVEEFATHMTAIAKRLEEDEQTGSQRYTYVRSGPDHFSMAFTYDLLAWELDADSDLQKVTRLGPPSLTEPWIRTEGFFHLL